MSSVSTSNLSGGASGAAVEEIGCRTKFVVPRYWIHQDAGAEVILTLKIQLTGCRKDRIKVQIWNWRQLLVNAACQLHQYKLEYRLPPGVRMPFPPKFAAATGILTCRFYALNPTCVICRASFSLCPVKTMAKDKSGSVLKRPGVELVQPRHWITYDGNAALFEAHLEGCTSSSQINFHIANNKVIIWAVLSPQLHYFLSLQLESSAESKWKAYFDRKLEMFTCSMALLGHYECGPCMAKRHLNAEGTSMERAEKSVGTQTKKVSFGYQSDLNVHSDGIKSRVKVFANSETKV